MSSRAGAACCALALAACAGTTLDHAEWLSGKDIPLAPYGMHEACTALEPGDRLDWNFHAHEPVAFNLHYHEGNAVVQPIQREGVREDAGIFTPTLAQRYCLMWEAGAAGAVLTFDAHVRRAAP